ncbi:gamma-glutamyltransferase family protein [Haloplasma contractile]|uniref:Gamma-glutamyltransferase Amino acid transport protein n=1 Tax=Haloplasma contractile SSD-17B TaxID=1033810 RepID=U2EEM6_9MOLU|nr:gamma-glutamyltransferase family protein [Haloplasma contractile]ERJ13151.1 Gamma-glutamyltransferase Amino acid transport protein [Haloplasma contractile SSD-17B]
MKRLGKILKFTGIGLISITLILVIIYLFLPKGPRDLMEFNDPYQVERASVTSDNYMASTGTPWATEAAMEIMENGGNAFDAAAASLLVLNVTYGEAASFPSVSPLLIYDAKTGAVRSYSGVGTAPEEATIELFKSEGHDTVPKLNILAQLLPASPDTIITLLKEYGTMSFSEISAPAIKIAKEGFPVHSMMMNDLSFSLIERLGMSIIMPYNGEVYLDGQWWRPLHYKDRFTLPDLAGTFEAMSLAEQVALDNGKDREGGLQAVRDYFYKGELADKIIEFHEDEGGLFTKEDLANYQGKWEEPLSGEFNEYTIYSNDTWTQGAVVPMVLQMLEGYDLKSMGHNSKEYMHTVLQAIELTMADREAYFADPDFVEVPIDGLLSKEYAEKRREQMTPNKAFKKMPEPGNPFLFDELSDTNRIITTVNHDQYINRSNGEDLRIGKDTSYLTIVDKEGNAVSLTPSDFPESPMVPGTGLTLGIRMTQFRLDEEHVNSLEPGKRPRITPNPSMVFKNGEFYMSFGTPGGDMQTQAMVQVFLNHVVFGMDIQDAIEAPRFRSLNWPDSFAPHDYNPGTIQLEQPLYDRFKDDMESYGYKTLEKEHWGIRLGGVCAIIKDQETGTLIGGADPREESWAAGR